MNLRVSLVYGRPSYGNRRPGRYISPNRQRQETMCLLIQAIKRNDPKAVTKILNPKSWNYLTTHSFYKAMLISVRRSQEGMSHLILRNTVDKLRKIESAELKKMWETVKDVIIEAAQKKMKDLVKELVELVGASKCVRYPRSPMLIALAGDNPEEVEILIKAGINPKDLLDMRYSDNYIIKFIVDQLASIDRMTEQKKETWKLMMPYFEAIDVLQSNLLDSLYREKKSGQVLVGLEKLGMEFNSFLTSGSDAVKSIIVGAMNKYDVSTMTFFLDHGFDVNSTVIDNNSTALHYIIKYLIVREIPAQRPLQLIFELIKRGADPCLKNDYGFSAEELSARRLGYCYDNSEAHLGVIKLILRLGYLPARDTRYILLVKISRELGMHDVVNEMELEKVSSLQCLCRRAIRSEQGGKINDFMNALSYPQFLKDFVLLSDFDWNEFVLNRDEDNDSKEEDCSSWAREDRVDFWPMDV